MIRAMILTLGAGLTYSLLVGLLVIAVISLINLSSIARVAVSCIAWYRNVMYLRSLPCPPRHWLWGHLLKVSNHVVLVLVTLLLVDQGEYGPYPH